MKLYPHQKEALDSTANLNKVAFFHDMGLGKTFTGAEKMIRLAAEVNLVVCQKSKVDDWVEHFKEHYSYDHDVFDLTTKLEFEAFVKVFKTNDISDDYKIVGVINYDLVWRRPELLKLTDFTLMLDESSLIQNEKSKRSKFILKLKPKNVILLSGTPVGGKYERLWSQLHLLGWDISRSLYWKQFVTVKRIDMLGRSIPIVTGYKNVDRLKEKMNQYGCKFLKTDEVFDLPSQQFIDVKVKNTKHYQTFRKHKVLIDGDITFVGDTLLTKMLYERQLCGSYNPNKLEALKDILASTEDRVIVFYNFKHELRAIEDVCIALDKPISLVNGDIKDLSVYDEHENSVTAIQYQAGAKGLNLQKANKIIYFTPTLSCEDYMQSIKRIHRIKQDRPCFYYRLIVKNSVEEKIYGALERGEDYTNALFEKECY